MRHLRTSAGVTVSYDVYGTGPPLVLVHGGFSDHASNWELVRPFFEPRFEVYAVARRGRGETDATEGHSVEDEGRDVATLIAYLADPVFLLGHSVEELVGQAHEGMTTAPELYANAVVRFLLG